MKMNSMMLGLLKWYRYLYPYIMGSRLVRPAQLGTDFNPCILARHYRLPAIRRMWLSAAVSPKKTEKPIIRRTSIRSRRFFRNVNSIPPYTEGTSFEGQKNAYAVNPGCPCNTYGTEETGTTTENKALPAGCSDRAQIWWMKPRRLLMTLVSLSRKTLWDTTTSCSK